MNFFLFLYIYSILFILINSYETIQLKFESNNYYIPIQLKDSKETEYFILSNIVPVNLFPSSKCSICEWSIRENNNQMYSLIENNIVVPYYYLNFTGDLYKSNVTIGSQIYSIDLVAFDSITFVEKYSGKGRFSLSFLNYCFKTEKKMFALSLNYDNGELDLGGYNPNKITDKSLFHVFNITKTNYTNEYQNLWYMNFNSLFINNYKLSNGSYKLSFDVNTNNFHIPKDFFFKYASLIFHQDSKCQIQPEGYFLCICDTDYKEKYGTFKFINENNDYIYVNITDYVFFEDSNRGSYCYVVIELNYENDLFIVGKYVMDNYYTIFDIDNNQIQLYQTNISNYTFDQKNIIIFLFSVCIGGILLLCCYFIYRKFYSNNEEDELNINEDLVQENDEEQGQQNEEEFQQLNEENDNHENNNINNNLIDDENDNHNIVNNSNNNDNNENN